MTKALKVLLLVVTLLPFAELLVYTVYVFKSMMGPPPRDFLGPSWYPDWLLYLWLCSMLAIYFTHVFKNRKFSRSVKILWSVILFLFNMFIMPVYWYLYIWRKQEALHQ